MNKPIVFAFTRTIMAYLVVFGTFGLIYILASKAIPVENKDILNIALGSVLTQTSTIVNYFFGTSKDKSDAEQAQVAAENK
jgi:uncharacterized membrane protein